MFQVPRVHENLASAIFSSIIDEPWGLLQQRTLVNELHTASFHLGVIVVVVGVYAKVGMLFSDTASYARSGDEP